MKIGIAYRLVLFLSLTAVLWTCINLFGSRTVYDAGKEVTKQVTQPSNANLTEVRLKSAVPGLLMWVGVFGTLTLFGLTMWSPLVEGGRKLKEMLVPDDMQSPYVLMTVPLLSVLLGGCAPYDAPEFQEIGNSQTGFLVQLAGDTNQGKFESKEYLEARKVATKRVQIPHEWVSTGRMPGSGVWQDTHRLILVDRAPVTRHWVPDSKDKDTKTGIWVESSDSVGFSTGITVTVMIKEEDAATFLYTYSSGSLTQVADDEIKARIQKIFSEEAAKYDMSSLREKKGTVIKAIEDDVVKFFSTRGITVTTIGMSGGFTYENSKIQDAIDGVFIAQREKEVNKAKLEAQVDANAKIESEAKATANAAMEKARGEAEGQKLILAVAKEAGKDPVFLQLKQIEVELKRIDKWNGNWPQWYMGGASGNLPMTMMLQAPEPPK